MKISKRLAYGLIWLAAVQSCGCGGRQPDYGALDLASVSGTVTLDGEPLEGAQIIFEADDRTFSYGQTDSSGQYSLMFNSEKAGIIPGSKIVRITTTGSLSDEDVNESEDGEAADNTAEKIPPKYNSNSELQIIVESGSNDFDFELKTSS